MRTGLSTTPGSTTPKAGSIAQLAYLDTYYFAFLSAFRADHDINVLYDIFPFMMGGLGNTRKDGEAWPRPCTKAHFGLQFFVVGGSKVITLFAEGAMYSGVDLTVIKPA